MHVQPVVMGEGTMLVKADICTVNAFNETAGINGSMRGYDAMLQF